MILPSKKVMDLLKNKKQCLLFDKYVLTLQSEQIIEKYFKQKNNLV